MKITFDRFIAIVNFLALVVGGIWAVIVWYPNYKTQTATLQQIQFNMQSDRQLPFDYEAKLNVSVVKQYSDGSRLYDIDYDVTNKNLSKSEMTVSYSVAELYLGESDQPELKIGEADEINDPPDPFHPESDGVVKWRRVTYDANVIDGDTNKALLDWVNKSYGKHSDGGLTAVLPSGTSNEYDPEFELRAMPNQYVAVQVAFGINDSLDVSGPNVGLIYDSQLLGDAETDQAKAGSQSSAATQLNRDAVARPEYRALPSRKSVAHKVIGIKPPDTKPTNP